MVIVILGVLAIFAAPRVFDTTAFDAKGFHDETLALLRFAQKSAVSHRRTVCVTINATGVSMTMFAANPATGACSAAPALTPPFSPRGGTGLSSTSTGFQFTPLGATDQVGAISISVANSTPIIVEASTGYVHD